MKMGWWVEGWGSGLRHWAQGVHEIYGPWPTTWILDHGTDVGNSRYTDLKKRPQTHFCLTPWDPGRKKNKHGYTGSPDGYRIVLLPYHVQNQKETEKANPVSSLWAWLVPPDKMCWVPAAPSSAQEREQHKGGYQMLAYDHWTKARIHSKVIILEQGCCH